MRKGRVNGVLVGRASLDAEQFLQIIEAVENAKDFSKAELKGAVVSDKKTTNITGKNNNKTNKKGASKTSKAKDTTKKKIINSKSQKNSVKLSKKKASKKKKSK